MSLREDLVQQIQTQLAADGIQYSPPLSKDGPVVFLARYYEYKARRIAKKPRKAIISRGLMAAPAWSAHEPALTNLIGIIDSAGDLGPYQTKRLEAFDLHDFLFSDWAIHHLHWELWRQALNSRPGQAISSLSRRWRTAPI